jgi:hypothetical protein
MEAITVLVAAAISAHGDQGLKYGATLVGSPQIV